MDYPKFVEVCGRCGTLITWDPEGKGVCECGKPLLQFMELETAKRLGIIEEG